MIITKEFFEDNYYRDSKWISSRPPLSDGAMRPFLLFSILGIYESEPDLKSYIGKDIPLLESWITPNTPIIEQIDEVRTWTHYLSGYYMVYNGFAFNCLGETPHGGMGSVRMDGKLDPYYQELNKDQLDDYFLHIRDQNIDNVLNN